MRFRFETFKGRIPTLDVRKLPEDHASVARNCRFDHGNLKPFGGLRAVHKPTITSTNGVYSIYRWSPDAGKDAEGAISSVENTTPVAINTSKPHGLLTGDRVYIDATGRSIDAKVYTVKVTSTTRFTLNNTSAAGTSSQGEWTKENGFWFIRATAGAKFVPTPIAGDVIEPVFFTTPGERPAYTYAPIATQGSSYDYPANRYWLGLPQPASAPALTLLGGGSADPALETTRAYVYAFVDPILGPGPISQASVTVVKPGQHVRVQRGNLPNGSYNISTWRVYRAITSADGTGAYQFVAEAPVSLTMINDSLSDVDVARNEVLYHANWYQPPADMQGLLMLANGVAVGYSKNQVCPSEPYQPHAYDPLKRVTLPLPVTGLGAWGTNVVAFTAADAYLISGTTPDAWSQEPLQINQGCLSAEAIVSLGPEGVIYPSPDGLILIGSNGARNLLEGYLTPDEWMALNPSSMRAFLWDGMFVCFYDNGTKGGFIFDPSENGVGWVDIDAYATGGYVDPVNDGLYLVVDGKIRRWDANKHKPLTYKYSSREFDANDHIVLTCGEADAKDFGDLTMRVYLDGSLLQTRDLTNDAIFRVPPKRGRYVRVELEGTSEVRSLDVAEHTEELKES